MAFEIIALTKENYKQWDDFCLKSDDAWIGHITDNLEYTLAYKPELKTKNLSFFVYEAGKIKAIVPLTLETYETKAGPAHEFSFGHGPIPASALANDLIGVKNDRKEKEVALEFIFNEIDRLAKLNGARRAYFTLNPLSPSFFGRTFNYLLKFGYIDVSLNALVIDLRKSEVELWNGLRRNHRRSVKKGKNFQINFYTSANITKDIFYAYKETHHKAAGRKTRPDLTFELMYEQLKKDLGFLVEVKLEGKQIGFEFYSIYKNRAEGFSAANDPAYESLPIRHRLEWEAMLWLKKRGALFYNIGWQQYHILPYDFPDKKQLDISHFKKGFGGEEVPLFMGEKYYDKDYFLNTYRERINKYADLMGQ